jgi:hypothetical protein
MDLKGEQRIAAPREDVWAALNDPEVLKRCIPGCQSLERTSASTMEAIAVIKVGPITARFAGAITLSDLDPPKGYRIEGEGQGGAAGFAKGGAVVQLESEGDQTVLRYAVSAQVGGKLAQLGGRLIEATARQMSAVFFKRFADEVTGDALHPSAPGAASSPARAGRRLQAPMARAASAGARRPTWEAILLIFAALLIAAWSLVIAQGFAGRPDAVAINTLILTALAAVVGFLAGRRTSVDAAAGGAVLMVDSALAGDLITLWNARREQAGPFGPDEIATSSPQPLRGSRG